MVVMKHISIRLACNFCQNVYVVEQSQRFTKIPKNKTKQINNTNVPKSLLNWLLDGEYNRHAFPLETEAGQPGGNRQATGEKQARQHSSNREDNRQCNRRTLAGNRKKHE